MLRKRANFKYTIFDEIKTLIYKHFINRNYFSVMISIPFDLCHLGF